MGYRALRELPDELHMDSPPSPGDPKWHVWAEQQTALRLRLELAERRAAKAEVSSPATLRLVPQPRPTVVRIHIENLTEARG